MRSCWCSRLHRLLRKQDGGSNRLPHSREKLLLRQREGVLLPPEAKHGRERMRGGDLLCRLGTRRRGRPARIACDF